MNYTEALEFFVENGISLNEEQLENLKEASAYTRHMRNVSKKYKDVEKARDELSDRLDNPNIKDLDDKLQYKLYDMSRNELSNNHGVGPTNYNDTLRMANREDGFAYDSKQKLKHAKEEFNKKINSAHPENYRGKKDHKRAGDYLAMQKAKKVLEN